MANYRRHLMKTLTDEEIMATIAIEHHPRFSDLTDSEKRMVVLDCDVKHLTASDLFELLSKLNLRVHKSYCGFSERYRYLVFEDDLHFLFRKSVVKNRSQTSFGKANVFVTFVIILIIAYLYYS